MYQIINFTDFCNAFRDTDRDNQFSLEGKRALFDCIERYEDEIGESLELDVKELCCEYTEADYAEIAEMYNIEADDEYGLKNAVREHLEQHTTIAGEVPGGFVYAEF